MPNWTFNHITTNNPEIILTFINEEGNFDFNKLAPMPDSLNIEDSSMKDMAIAYFITERLTIPHTETNLSALISNRFSKDWAGEIIDRLKTRNWKDTYYPKGQLYEMGKQYMFNYEHYGCFTWYDWCNRNWNTKWNACDTYYDTNNPTEVEFNTAWDAPEPIFAKMCAMFPESEILFDCEFEDGYYVEYANSDGILEKIYECSTNNEDE